ncbi:helix-turn-helix domain-containing protein [Haloarchaeobius sp. DT45]|uniref:helix-turn-helix domain-containing protein n=1 Tax=Haloarchaeobius sp. DT45 TaxID=3446116 RepID=UPI003F6AC067
MSEECDEAELLALLDDEYARAILTATSTEPMSATELAETCEMSPPTVYRRVERLQNCGLLAEDMQYAEDGHHYAVYRSTVDHVTVSFADGDLTVDVAREEEAVADRFTRLYEGLR